MERVRIVSMARRSMSVADMRTPWLACCRRECNKPARRGSRGSGLPMPHRRTFAWACRARARDRLTPSPGRSLRASCPSLARCWPRFGILPALGHQRRLRGTGNPSQSIDAPVAAGILPAESAVHADPHSAGKMPAATKRLGTVARRSATPAAPTAWRPGTPRRVRRGIGGRGGRACRGRWCRSRHARDTRRTTRGSGRRGRS